MSYSLLAHAAAGSTNTSNITTAVVDTTGANLIVVPAAFFNEAGGTVTDSKGNTSTALTPVGTGAIALLA